MSSELTKPPFLLAPERFLTGSGLSWSPGPCRRLQPIPESSQRAEGGLRSYTDRPSASPPSSSAASEPGAPASASRPAGRHCACSQAGKLITLGNSPKPTHCSLLPFLCACVFSPIGVCSLAVVFPLTSPPPPPLYLLTRLGLLPVWVARTQAARVSSGCPCPSFLGNLGVREEEGS